MFQRFIFETLAIYKVIHTISSVDISQSTLHRDTYIENNKHVCNLPKNLIDIERLKKWSKSEP